MRKPKITIQQQIEKNNIRLQNAKRPNQIKATNKKRLVELKNRYKIFDKSIKILQSEKIKEQKLFEVTKEKIKGKNKKQISNIWKKYSIKKENLKISAKEKIINILPSGFDFIKTKSNPYTKEKLYKISSNNPEKSITDLMNKRIKENSKLRSFTVILEGVDWVSGGKVYI